MIMTFSQPSQKMPAESSFAGGAALIKIYGVKVIAGVLAVAISFMFLWPKSAQEGFVRIASTIFGSLLWGDALAAWVHSFANWWPNTPSSNMVIYVAAGVPAWWILGIIFRTLRGSENKTAQQLLQEFRRP